MRTRPSILHLDLDAFFASVEQRDKPSLRGKPVVVGGIGHRGVVATASYEARVFGVRSAMPTHEARRRCPHAAYLAGRFDAYRAASRQVMQILRSLSPLVEPLSLDEAFVDLEAATRPVSFDTAGLNELVAALKSEVAEVTGGLTASVGVGTSKFIAKLASELAKPDGYTIVPSGTELDLIGPMGVGAIPGVGPVTRERLARIGAHRVADLQRMSLAELTRELGKAHAAGLHALAYARDERRVEPERETKSISVEDTFEDDERDQARLQAIVERDAAEVARRVRAAGLFARTVTIKVRLPDFSTHTRARSIDGATDRPDVIAQLARSMLAGIDTRLGVRLLGVGVTGLTAVAQEELFTLPGQETPSLAADQEPQDLGGDVKTTTAALDDSTADTWERRRPTSWLPGADVEHEEFGPGWVWGTGLGRVTVRFETATSGPGPVRTLAADDPALHLARAH